MASPIKVGYDIGVNSIKIAVNQGGIRLIEERLPENLMEGEIVSSPNAFSQFLRTLRTENKIPAGPAGLVLPSGQSLCKLVSMPMVTEDQVLINLPYEFVDYIQDRDEDYYFDYAVCDQEPQEVEENTLPLMAAAASKRQLSLWEEIFSKAGIKIKQVLPPAMATLALAKSAPDHDVCFVDLGQRHTRVTIIHGDRMQVRRNLPLGCADVDLAIANSFDVDPYLANTYKETNFQDALVLPECLGIYERIAVELLKVFNFYQFTNRESGLSGVYLVGGGSKILPLRQAIEASLGAECLPLSEVMPTAAPDFFNAIGILEGGM